MKFNSRLACVGSVYLSVYTAQYLALLGWLVGGLLLVVGWFESTLFTEGVHALQNANEPIPTHIERVIRMEISAKLDQMKVKLCVCRCGMRV